MCRNDFIRREELHFRFRTAAGLASLLLLASFQHVGQAPGRASLSGPGLSGLEAPPDPPPAQPSSASCGSGGDLPNLYLHSGEFHVSAVDLRIPGRGLDYIWARKYRSRNGPDTSIGKGWDFSYGAKIQSEGQNVRLFDGNTRSDLYVLRVGGVYTAEQFFREGRFEADNTFTLTFADGGTWGFRALDGTAAQGRLQSVSDRNGNALLFAYDGAGRLTTVTDTLNRNVVVSYDANGRIAAVTDFAGRSVVYSYYQDGDAGGSAGDLRSVRSPIVVGTPNGNDFPAGKTTVYTYTKGFADERLNHNLLTITDPKGQTWLVNTYSSVQDPSRVDFDRVVRQQRGGPADTIELVYRSLRQFLYGAPTNERLQAVVNDAVGNVREHFYDRLGRLVRKLEYTGRADPAQPTTPTSNRPTNPLRADDPQFFEVRFEYNADSLLTRIVHPNGNETRRVYELALDPGAPWRSRGNLRELRRLPGSHVPAGDQAEIVELYEYEVGTGGCCGTTFVKRHTDARGNVTTHDYDAFGNRVHTQHPIASVVEDYEYDSSGRMTAHVLPPNGQAGAGTRRRDEMRWYGPGDGAQNGYLKESVVDAGGLALATRQEYDAVGNVVRTIDPRGNDTLFTRNALNQVVRELSREVASGGGVRHEGLSWYDANDNLVRVDVENRDEDGVLQPDTHFTTIHELDDLDQVVRTCREVGSFDVPLGHLSCTGLPGSEFVTQEYAYDGNRNRTLVRHGEAVNGNQPANTETTLYDERDLVFRVIRAQGDPGSSTRQRDYDGNRSVRAVREGLEGGAHVTISTHDGFDRLVSAVDPMGNETERHYDAEGGLVGEIVRGELVDVAGSAGNVRLSESSWQYDAMGRRTVERVEHFDGVSQAPIADGRRTTTTQWTDTSEIASVVDDHGHAWTVSYDGANRRGVVTDPRGNSATLAYDANGNAVSQIEVDESDLGNPDVARTTTYAYDGLDRLVATVDPAGGTRTLGRDSRGNVVREVDPRGNVVQSTFDGLDRLVRTERTMTDTGAAGGNPIGTITTTQAFDASSRRILQTDPSGNPTSYVYDALGRLVRTTFADGKDEQVLAFDAHGDALQVRDANGTTVTSAYDSLHRLVSRSASLGPETESYRYDGLSRTVRAEDDDSLVTFEHDSLGNVLRETSQVLPGGAPRTVTTLPDAVGNPLRVVYPGGRTILRTFDVLERAVQIQDQGTGQVLAGFAYLGPRRDSEDTSALADFIVFNVPPGRVNLRCATGCPGSLGIERSDFVDGTRLDVSYEAARRIAQSRHSRVAGNVTIDQRVNGWDLSGNKIQVSESFGGTQRSYAYDSADRLIRSAAMPPGTPVQYLLDDAGNRTQVVGGNGAGPYTCNAALPEPADCQMSQYTTTPTDSRAYDANGNLTQKPSSGAAFTFDSRNRLVRAQGGGIPLTTFRYDCLGRRIERQQGANVSSFFFDGPQEIEEQGAGGATVATYVWGPEGGLVQMQRSGQTWICHGDDLGSLVAVTDAAGNCVERYAYTDFGRASFFSGAGVPLPGTQVGACFLFHGMRAEVADAYLLGARFFEPDSGRFLQRDPEGIWADPCGSGNPFAFAGDNPQTFVAFAPQDNDPYPGALKGTKQRWVTDWEDSNYEILEVYMPNFGWVTGQARRRRIIPPPPPPPTCADVRIPQVTGYSPWHPFPGAAGWMARADFEAQLDLAEQVKSSCGLACTTSGGTCTAPARCEFNGKWSTASVTRGTQFTVLTTTTLGIWTSSKNAQRRWALAAPVDCECRCK